MYRRPSAPWSRLKPPTIDALEILGLPSKGDNRLLDYKTQETYFSKIVDRYMQFCAAAGRRDDKLDKAFASLNLEEDNPSSGAGRPAPKLNVTQEEQTQEPVVLPPIEIPNSLTEPPRGLSVIIMAMRKLREGILASSRTDSFAQGAYIFVTRAAILTSTYEAYLPSLLHLLYRIHPATPLSKSELREFVGYYILDLTCRQGQYGEALAVRHMWGFKDERVESVLQATLRDQWVLFWRLFSVVDGYQRRLMGWAEDEMRKHALKCLGKSYLSVDRSFLEATAHRSWDILKEKDNVEWDLEGDKVIIRRIRKK